MESFITRFFFLSPKFRFFQFFKRFCPQNILWIYISCHFCSSATPQKNHLDVFSLVNFIFSETLACFGKDQRWVLWKRCFSHFVICKMGHNLSPSLHLHFIVCRERRYCGAQASLGTYQFFNELDSLVGSINQIKQNISHF